MSTPIQSTPIHSEHFDEVGQIIAYEQGELTEDEVIDLFQHLLNNGHAWELQGSYGRTAKALLDAGLIHIPHSNSDND